MSIHIKKLVLITALSLFVLSCKNNKTLTFTEIDVTILNHKSLDSIIIYDKSMSWEIKTVLKFDKSNSAKDTLKNIKNKYYQIYTFKDGVQSASGEILLSSGSKTSLEIDEQNPLESIVFDGTHKSSNNFLSFTKSTENELSNLVRDGIEQEKLIHLISKKNNLIEEKGKALNVSDSLKIYVKNEFKDFSDVLVIKNKKYLYKASLVNKNGSDFIFKDADNNDVSLDSFKGKFVYIDVWATWCKPCKVEYTFLKTLEEHYADNSNLQIISVSTDRDFRKWTNYLDDNSIQGIQLYTGDDSDFVTFYDIGALPRFIFLNPEGKIISPDEIRPSNPELFNTINSYLNKTI